MHCESIIELNNTRPPITIELNTCAATFLFPLLLHFIIDLIASWKLLSRVDDECPIGHNTRTYNWTHGYGSSNIKDRQPSRKQRKFIHKSNIPVNFECTNNLQKYYITIILIVNYDIYVKCLSIAATITGRVA